MAAIDPAATLPERARWMPSLELRKSLGSLLSLLYSFVYVYLNRRMRYGDGGVANYRTVHNTRQHSFAQQQSLSLVREPATPHEVAGIGVCAWLSLGRSLEAICPWLVLPDV